MAKNSFVEEVTFKGSCFWFKGITSDFLSLSGNLQFRNSQIYCIYQKRQVGSTDCFKTVAGTGLLVDDFLVFNLKTSFLTSSSVTSANSKSFEMIPGKNSRIFLLFTCLLKIEVICSMSNVLHFVWGFKLKFFVMFMK